MTLSRAVWTLALLLGTASMAGAQQSGSVTGRVVDQTGAVLPGVTVSCIRGAEVTTVTDGAGGYRFENVPAGSAELAPKADALKSITIEPSK